MFIVSHTKNTQYFHIRLQIEFSSLLETNTFLFIASLFTFHRVGDVAGNREKELATDITKSDDGKCGERRIGMGNEEWGMGNGKGEWRLDNED